MSAEETQSFHGSPHFGVRTLLQRLAQGAALPLATAQKMMGAFTLNAEPLPYEVANQVQVLIYPQNPLLGEPELRTMQADDIQAGLVNARFRVEDSRGIVVRPNAEGGYIYLPHQPEFAAVNAFYHATFTLRMFERYARRALPWAFGAPRLTIDPHAGDMNNAFYSERDRLLGFHTFQTPDGLLHSTAESADIVTHETAHAVLDGLRDLYNESFGLVPRAFHESFGDMAAVLAALHDDALIRRLLELTDGNLRVSNFVSELAEHLVPSELLPQHSVYLRNAINDLVLQPFDELVYLPENPETTLSRQEHNYSRVFTGAFYDALVAIYERYCQTMPAYLALHRARDVMGSLLVLAIELAPVGELDYADMARAFLTADDLENDGAYYAILRDVFAARAILTAAQADAHRDALRALPDVRLPEAMNNALAAALFLEQVVLPALALEVREELLPMATYRNGDGYVFMTYFSMRTLTLEGAQYQAYSGTQLEVFGGLTLGFDATGRLRSVVYRPVTDEDVRQIKVMVAEMIAYERIAHHMHPYTFVPIPSPKGLFVPPSPQPRIIKYPTQFDRIPEKLVSFREYLLLWRAKRR